MPLSRQESRVLACETDGRIVGQELEYVAAMITTHDYILSDKNTCVSA